MRRLNKFTERHPILSMIVGWAAYFAIVLAFYPADQVNAVSAPAHYARGTT